ncbi:MAG: DUF6547 family protein [Planctomycetota bacterium]|jgi:hypothetical protein
MPADLPQSPRKAYQRIIDELVEGTPGVTAQRITKGDSIPAVDDDDARDFTTQVESLSQTQREVLARLCDSQRHGGIHDALAVLSWWIDCADVSFHYRNAEMPVDQSGMGLHGDFVGRSQGWQWPPEV